MKTSIRTSIVTALLFASAAANAVTPITPGGVFRAGQTATLPIGETDDTWQVLDDARYPDGIVEIEGGFARLSRELSIGRATLYRVMNKLEEKNKIVKNGSKIRIINLTNKRIEEF